MKKLSLLAVAFLLAGAAYAQGVGGGLWGRGSPASSSSYSASQAATDTGWYSDGGSTATTLRAAVGAGGISTDGGIVSTGILGFKVTEPTNVNLIRNSNVNYTGLFSSSTPVLEIYANGAANTTFAQNLTTFGVGVTSAVASGGVAFQRLTGAKNCAGTGGTDCDTSDGTNRAFTGGIQVGSAGYGLNAAGNVSGLSASGSTVTLRSSGILNVVSSTSTVFTTAAVTLPVACTSPTITHGVATSFQADVGTTCAAVSTFAFTLPATANGWDCRARHKTATRAAAAELECADDTTTGITCTNFGRVSGLPVVFTDADDIVVSCTGR